MRAHYLRYAKVKTILSDKLMLELGTNSGFFFLTLAAEKTKTQEKNSRQKLKEKTQPLGGFSLQNRKLKKKTKISS